MATISFVGHRESTAISSTDSSEDRSDLDASPLGWLGRQTSAPKPGQELALTGASSLLLPTDTVSRSLSLRISIPKVFFTSTPDSHWKSAESFGTLSIPSEGDLKPNPGAGLSAQSSLEIDKACRAFLMSPSIVFVPLPGSVLNSESGKRSRASTVSTLCCFNILITHDGGWRTSTGSLSSKGFLAATLPKPKLFRACRKTPS